MKKFILIFFLLSSTCLFAQRVDSLNFKFQQVENKIINNATEIKVSAAEAKLNYAEVKEEISKLNIFYNSFKILIALGIGGVVGFLVSRVFIRKQIIKLIHENINRDKGLIRDIVQHEELENKIKVQAKILVLTFETKRRRILEDLFDNLGFGNNLKCEIIDQYNHSFKGNDIYIFDTFANSDEEVTIVQAFVDNIDELVGVVFVPGNSKAVFNNRNNLNGANTTFTLYQQIINVGKYQHASGKLKV
jgi:Nucleotidyltransferase-Associated Rossmannoid Fold